MIIHVLANDGSPLGCTLRDVYGEGKRGIGVGGSEIALLTLCEAWSKRGEEVILYNNPLEHHASPFEQRAICDFNPLAERDVLIIFRSPNSRSYSAKGLKVWLSCDQYTTGSFRDFSGSVDKIVCISPFHKQYFMTHYEMRRQIEVIDLPVRVEDYTRPLPKGEKRVLFSSVPDRGLMHLFFVWPEIAKKTGAILTITSDYRLWGLSSPQNESFRVHFAQQKDVRFLGAVKRERLVEEQLRADVLAYPCTYSELQCLACAEAEVAGAYPITSGEGALPTTNLGIVLAEDVRTSLFQRHFIDAVVETLNSPDLPRLQQEVREKSIARFSPETVLKQWDEKIFQKG